MLREKNETVANVKEEYTREKARNTKHENPNAFEC